MGRKTKIVKVINKGNEDCVHTLTCNPTASMDILKGKMVFAYDRKCIECAYQDEVQSNMIGNNTQLYK